MSNLPQNNSQNTKPVRDKHGRFKSQNNDNVVLNNPLPTTGGADVFNASPSANSPTGQVNKEFQPVQPNYEQIYQEEAQKTKELKEQLEKLEKEAEVKEIKGEIELPEIVKKAGVEEAGEEVPVPSLNDLKLPLDDNKTYQTAKKFKKFQQDISSSVTWLALWCIRQLARVHVKLKEVSGQVVRVKE